MRSIVSNGRPRSRSSFPVIQIVHLLFFLPFILLLILFMLGGIFFAPRNSTCNIQQTFLLVKTYTRQTHNIMSYYCTRSTAPPRSVDVFFVHRYSRYCIRWDGGGPGTQKILLYYIVQPIPVETRSVMFTFAHGNRFPLILQGLYRSISVFYYPSFFPCWFNKLIALAPATERGSNGDGLFGLLDGWPASRFLGWAVMGGVNGETVHTMSYRISSFEGISYRARRFIDDSETHLRSCPFTGIRILMCALNVNIFHYLRRRRLVWALSRVLCAIYGGEGRPRVFLYNII